MKKKKPGFTILEVILSLAIFAILLIPLANLILYSTRTSKQAEEKQQAKILAQSTIESIKNNGNVNQNGVTYSPSTGQYQYSSTGDKYIVEGSIKGEKSINSNNDYNKDFFNPLNDEVNNTIVISNDSIKFSLGRKGKINDLISVAKNEINTNELNISIDNYDNFVVQNLPIQVPFKLDGPVILYLKETRNNKLKINFTNNGSKKDIYIFRDANITSQQFDASIDREIRGKDEHGKIIEKSPVDLHRNMPLQGEIKKGVYYIDLKVKLKDSKDDKIIEEIKCETELMEG